jgi:hypothetical protein
VNEPALSWAITWLGIAFFYFWPFAVFQGTARMAVGIPWLAVTIIATLVYLYRKVPPRPEWVARYEEIHERTDDVR